MSGFDLEQLKRDNGRCLYDDKPAYAHVMPSGRLAIEYTDAQGYLHFTDCAYAAGRPLRNLPRKHLVQLWQTTIGGKSVTLGSQFVPPPGWTLKAQREIEEGEGL